METIAFGNNYGSADRNIKLNNGQVLHNAGFKGKGMHIGGVIDAGFNHLPEIEMLDNLDIKGYKALYMNMKTCLKTPISTD